VRQNKGFAMNCEKCQELIHELLDGSISRSDELTLNTHLRECLDCDSVRQDLTSIVSFCRSSRGEYEAPPNSRALWLRIRNVIESETIPVPSVARAQRKPFLADWMGRSWELSLPQLASLVAAIVLCVSLVTVVGVRRWGVPAPSMSQASFSANSTPVTDRVFQRQQLISYWNQRVELNKARWSPEMRATFERNLQVIDQAVSQSLNELDRNPHDEISEQMLNESLNDKLALLKEFSDL
jgi:negative regulator of sigma E activity